MLRIFGYCRISPPKQNIERQVRNIPQAVDLVVLQEPQINTDMYRRTLQEKIIILPLHSGDEATYRLTQGIIDALRIFSSEHIMI